MGPAPSSMSDEYVPNAIVAFGSAGDRGSALKELQSNIGFLNSFIASINTVVENGSGFISLLADASPYTSFAAKFVSAIHNFIAVSDALGKAIDNLAENIYSTILKGKLSALKNHLVTMQDNRSSPEQKIMQLVSVISIFHEILPIFSDNNSILKRKYYLGAQLFVPICGLLKQILMIADNTPTYHNPGIGQLREDYQSTLRLYKFRCIRQRLRSIGIAIGGLGPRPLYAPNYARNWYADDLTTYPHYFYFNKRADNIVKGHGDLIHEECDIKRRMDCLHGAVNVVDEWDYRGWQDMTYTTVTLHEGEKKRVDLEHLHEKVIHEYRVMVTNVMEDFFDSVSLYEGVYGMRSWV